MSKLVTDWMFPMDLVYYLRPGDLVVFDRGAYQHWGVFIGREEHQGKRVNKVIHLVPVAGSRSAGTSRQATVVKESLKEVAAGGKVRLDNSKDFYQRPFDGASVVLRARRELRMAKERTYDMFFGNAELFACFCRYGKDRF
ncbi:unnamed protein product [Cylicocyclus nassatus]|uniref:LRAT domain-containing protein n=1 Tax=Cylicocyclus nassatus TaxID=53992 RepID=A0AA36H0J9_CYLNA|nr:unnamed protein product [Cylicocyclus nassatus]